MMTANRTSFVVVLFGKDRLAFSGTFSCGFSFLYDILLLSLTGLYLVAQSRIVGVASAGQCLVCCFAWWVSLSVQVGEGIHAASMLSLVLTVSYCTARFSQLITSGAWVEDRTQSRRHLP